MGYIYLAAPYSHNVGSVAVQNIVQNSRFKVVEFMTYFYMKQHKMVFSPLVHCHGLAQHYELPTDFNFWKHWNKACILPAQRLDVLQFPNWENSVGVKAEIEFAHSIDCAVEFVYWEEIKKTIETFSSGKLIAGHVHDLEHTYKYT